MHFILALAVVGAGDRGGALHRHRTRRVGQQPSGWSTTSSARVGRGDVDLGAQLSRASNAPAARVALAMLQRVHATGASEAPVRGRRRRDAGACRRCTRRLAHLNVLANIATLLGLLGTIVGPDHGVLGRGRRGPVAALGVPRRRHLDRAQRHRVRPHRRDPDARARRASSSSLVEGHRRAGRRE